MMISCTGYNRAGNEPAARDTVYTQQAAMSIYAYQPLRALEIIDSAVIVGNMSEWRADMNRARVYSATQIKDLVRLDTAETICKRLLQHDSVLANPKRQQDVLEILTYTERMQNDTVGWLKYSYELVEVCRQVGSLAFYDGLRTEAEIGAALCALGQMEQGMLKLDSVITALNDVNTFAALDAFIIASKRKIIILGSHNRYAETLPVARRIIKRLDDFEANPEVYHDGSHREPKTDEKRAGYIRFYRNQTQNYITAAYTALSESSSMLATFSQIEDGAREATAREHIARYKALEKQMEVERQKTKADEATLIAFGIGIMAFLAVLFSVIVIRKNSAISRKNKILAQQIAESLNYKELYLQQKDKQEPENIDNDLNAMTDEQLFHYINDIIIKEKLFLDSSFGRQTVMERFNLSKERVGTIFAKRSEYPKMTSYILQLRLEYAAKLLVEQPEMSIMQIAETCGFGSHKYFSNCFHQHFSMTPSEFREAKQNTLV